MFLTAWAYICALVVVFGGAALILCILHAIDIARTLPNHDRYCDLLEQDYLERAMQRRRNRDADRV